MSPFEEALEECYSACQELHDLVQVVERFHICPHGVHEGCVHPECVVREVMNT